MSTPTSLHFDALGTHCEVTIWDPLPTATLEALEQEIVASTRAYEARYSRFQRDSLVWQLVERRGIVRVPAELIHLLRLYETFYERTHGALNPVVGQTLADLGYDDVYSLRARSHITRTAGLHEALSIVDDEHLAIHQAVLLDLGAIGKGYWIDQLHDLLQRAGLRRTLVNAGGDIRYEGDGTPLRAGLEDPTDSTRAIGVLEITSGSLCASSGNRRRWHSDTHHILDARTGRSPHAHLASWVHTEQCALADGLATSLLLVPPQRLQDQWAFAYAVLDDQRRVTHSADFRAEWL
jgi:FAD:protein FMN transferase